MCLFVSTDTMQLIQVKNVLAPEHRIIFLVLSLYRLVMYMLWIIIWHLFTIVDLLLAKLSYFGVKGILQQQVKATLTQFMSSTLQDLILSLSLGLYNTVERGVLSLRSSIVDQANQTTRYLHNTLDSRGFWVIFQGVSAILTALCYLLERHLSTSLYTIYQMH